MNLLSGCCLDTRYSVADRYRLIHRLERKQVVAASAQTVGSVGGVAGAVGELLVGHPNKKRRDDGARQRGREQLEQGSFVIAV